MSKQEAPPPVNSSDGEDGQAAKASMSTQQHVRPDEEDGQAAKASTSTQHRVRPAGEDGQAAEASTSTQQHDRSDGEDGQAAQASTSTQHSVLYASTERQKDFQAELLKTMFGFCDEEFGLFEEEPTSLAGATESLLKAREAKFRKETEALMKDSKCSDEELEKYHKGVEANRPRSEALLKKIKGGIEELEAMMKGRRSVKDIEAKSKEFSATLFKQLPAVWRESRTRQETLPHSAEEFEALSRGLEALSKNLSGNPKERKAGRKDLIAAQDDLFAIPSVREANRKGVLSELRDRAVYQKTFEEGRETVHRTRLMLVGQERVGKTSLMRSLTHESFNSSEMSTEGVTTDCTIDITPVTAQSWKRKTGVSTSLTRELMNGLEDESYKHIGIEQLQHLRVRPSSSASQTKMTATQFSGTTVDSAPGGKHLSRSSKFIEKAMSEGGITEKNTDRPTLYNIWDFAGQDLYYTTHQTFLSSRAIYLVVFNLCQDLDKPVPVPKKGSSGSTTYRTTPIQYLDFWMHSIFTYTKENCSQKELKQNSPPIFIVGTHRNSVGGDDMPEDQRKGRINNIFERIRDEIKDKPYYPHVVSKFYSIENSLEDNQKIQALRKHIEDVADEEPYMRERIPLNWLTFDDEKGQISGGSPVMTLKEVMNTFEIEDKTELLKMLKFYHDLGHIIYFGADGAKESQALKDVVILEPQWLIDAFKKILTVKHPKEQTAKYRKSWDRLQENGILDDVLIDHMWQDILEHKQALLALMDKFDLLCERVDEPREEEKSSTASSTATQPCPANASYYVPSMLRERTSRLLQYQTTERNSNVFYVDFNEFLPDGLYHRLVVRALRWSQKLGGRNPRLLFDQANFYVDDHHEFALQMVHKSNLEYVKVSVTRVEVYPPPQYVEAPSGDVTCKVKDFVGENLQNLKTMWIERINYSISVQCPDKKVLHFLPLEKCMAKPTVVCHFEKSHVVVKTDEIQAMFKQESFEEEASPREDRQPMTDIHFREIAKILGKEWEQLATYLGIKPEEVEKIKIDHNASGVNEQIFQMLVQWRQKRGNEVDKMREEFIHALKMMRNLHVFTEVLNILVSHF